MKFYIFTQNFISVWYTTRIPSNANNDAPSRDMKIIFYWKIESNGLFHKPWWLSNNCSNIFKTFDWKKIPSQFLLLFRECQSIINLPILIFRGKISKYLEL